MSGYYRNRDRGDEDRQRRVYVGNLPPDIREKDLTDLFYRYGNICHIDLMKNQHSAGTPFAFVEFENKRCVFYGHRLMVNVEKGYLLKMF